MNHGISDWVLRHYRSPKRSGASQRKFVLLLIASTTNSRGWAVQETVGAIAGAADLGERQVRRYVRELESEGVLERHKQSNGAAANTYRVLVPGLEQSSKPPQPPRAATARTSTPFCLHSMPACSDCLSKGTNGVHVSRATVTA